MAPLPANTPAFGPKADAAPKADTPKATDAKATKTVTFNVNDPRKVAAHELSKAQMALIDAEDALKAAQENLTAKTKAFDTLRRAK